MDQDEHASGDQHRDNLLMVKKVVGGTILEVERVKERNLGKMKAQRNNRISGKEFASQLTLYGEQRAHAEEGDAGKDPAPLR